MEFQKRFFQKLFILTFVLLLFQDAQSKGKLLFPVSFGVVRQSSIAVNFTTYMKKIGFPNINQNGHNVGYNIIALDGFKTQTTFSSIGSDLSPLGTWVNVFSRILGNSRNIYGRSSSQVQNYIKTQFNNRASKILINAYSFQRPVSEKNASATEQANTLAQFVSTNNLDGVSIDFEDFNSVKEKTASQWLKVLLKNLRKQLGKDRIIVLTIPPTFISEIALFRNPLINSYVDLFVIKYYNLLNENYNSFETLFNKAVNYTGTGLWEIQTKSEIKIDICKTVISKPSSLSGTWNKDSFSSAQVLNAILLEGKTKYSWFGGYANPDFGSDQKSQFQLAVLNSLRQHCLRLQTCFCK